MELQVCSGFCCACQTSVYFRSYSLTGHTFVCFGLLLSYLTCVSGCSCLKCHVFVCFRFLLPYLSYFALSAWALFVWHFIKKSASPWQHWWYWELELFSIYWATAGWANRNLYSPKSVSTVLLSTSALLYLFSKWWWHWQYWHVWSTNKTGLNTFKAVDTFFDV